MASTSDLEELNRRIRLGEIKKGGDDTIATEALNAALLRADKRLAFPIRDEIPVLLMEEALAL